MPSDRHQRGHHAEGSPVDTAGSDSGRYEDQKFAEEAKERESATFLAHVRYASTGGLEPRNTHPFTRGGRIFAHNGVLGGLDTLDRALGDYENSPMSDESAPWRRCRTGTITTA